MTDNVLTILNHGTDFHRDKRRDPQFAQELISQLSEGIAGNEARLEQTGQRTEQNPMPFALRSGNPNYLICEGPGSEEVSETDSKDAVHHAYPGKFNPIFNTEKTPGKSQELNPGLELKGGRKYWLFGEKQTSEFQDSFMGNTPEAWKLMGLALGRGWDDNVYKAVWMLTHLKFELEQPIDTVNLVGWSRGAVTCLKMANKLFEVFEDTIEVNIFAVDPVPGGYTTRTPDMLQIPPNVRNYLAILALDADGGNFLPTDRQDMKLLAPQSQHGKGGNPDSLNATHAKPHVHFLPMPGNHSDVVNVNLSSEAVGHSAKLCRHLALQFLMAYGTPILEGFRSSNLLSNDQIVASYTTLFPQLKAIAEAASTGGYLSPVEGWKTERAVRQHRGTYVCNPDQYLNEHHHLCALGQQGHLPELPPDDHFTAQDWVKWENNKTIELPPQSDLRKMGISV